MLPASTPPPLQVFPASASPKPPSITLRAKADVAIIAAANRDAEASEAAARADAAAQRASLAAFTSTLRGHILAGEDVAAYWKPVQRQATVQQTLNTPLPELHVTRQHLTGESALEAAEHRLADLSARAGDVANLRSSMEDFVTGLLEEAKTTLSATQELEHKLTARKQAAQAQQQHVLASGASEGDASSSPDKAAHAERAGRSESPSKATNEPDQGPSTSSATRPTSSASARAALPPKGKKGKSSRPAWALSEAQVEDLEMTEEQELLAFAENLDFDAFVHQLDDVELQEAFDELQVS